MWTGKGGERHEGRGWCREELKGKGARRKMGMNGWMRERMERKGGMENGGGKGENESVRARKVGWIVQF